MTADPRIAALRKIARANGWQVESVSRAKRRAPIALRASRIYRAAWQPSESGVLSQYPTWEHLEINIDVWADEAGEHEQVSAGHLYSHRGPYRVDTIVGVEQIEAALLRSAPAATSVGVVCGF